MDKTVFTVLMLLLGFAITGLSYYQLQDNTQNSKIWKLFIVIGILIFITGICLVLGLV